MRVEIIEQLISDIINEMRRTDKEYQDLSKSDPWIKEHDDWTSYSKTFHTTKVKQKIQIYEDVLLRIKELKTFFEID